MQCEETKSLKLESIMVVEPWGIIRTGEERFGKEMIMTFFTNSFNLISFVVVLSRSSPLSDSGRLRRNGRTQGCACDTERAECCKGIDYRTDTRFSCWWFVEDAPLERAEENQSFL
ncbi:unnamed protein product [Microthlaspi erraticum]|uniref:Uncharacterized protein n=1 Tax=Microthlaspi erraticum TaxID=1685480 RepID=A0A6D2IN56_9BRAS|nr:unnamed protein product [Microthlaspi erraticum]